MHPNNVLMLSVASYLIYADIRAFRGRATKPQANTLQPIASHLPCSSTGMRLRCRRFAIVCNDKDIGVPGIIATTVGPAVRGGIENAHVSIHF